MRRLLQAALGWLDGRAVARWCAAQAGTGDDDAFQWFMARLWCDTAAPDHEQQVRELEQRLGEPLFG